MRPWRPLDDLIRPQQQRWWDREAEGLGRFAVEDEPEFRGLLHREIAGFRPSQDPVDVFRGATKHMREIRAVGHEDPCLRHLTEWAHRRQTGFEPVFEPRPRLRPVGTTVSF